MHDQFWSPLGIPTLSAEKGLILQRVTYTRCFVPSLTKIMGPKHVRVLRKTYGYLAGSNEVHVRFFRPTIFVSEGTKQRA